MKYLAITSVLAAVLVAGNAQAATVNLADNTFSSVQYEAYVQGPLGPITSFTETVGGITFSFAAGVGFNDSFYSVGTWGNGFSNTTAPWALGLGDGGAARGFTLSVSQNVTLDSFLGIQDGFNVNPVFDVTGLGVSSVGNTFSKFGVLGIATPGLHLFNNGPLSLVAGETYSFLTTNPSNDYEVGYITGFNFSSSVAPVPAPAALPLMLGGLGLLGVMSRRRRRAT